jgi:hypothetical protein
MEIMNNWMVVVGMAMLMVGCDGKGVPPEQQDQLPAMSLGKTHEGWVGFHANGKTFEVEAEPSIWGLSDDINLAAATCANEGARLPTSVEWMTMVQLEFFGMSIPRSGIARELFRDDNGASGWLDGADAQIHYAGINGWFMLRCARSL